MRVKRHRGGLSVRAIAGTHTVLLAMDLLDPSSCLGFAIRRTDHTEGETAWLRGMKTFASVVADPPKGSDYSTREHPIQDFQWGDYSAKPGHQYTYEVHAMGGQPGALVDLAVVEVTVRTEAEDDGRNGIWFNRGVAGSQAFARRFPDFVPGSDLPDSHPAMVWLSRGLAEAFIAFCGEALGPGWALRGAFYEFTWDGGLQALAAARARGVDVQLVVHGRDRDSKPDKDDDTTAAQSHAAAARNGLLDAITWRTAPNSGALQHNKYLVLLHDGQPVAVWTGSTNLTRGGIFGHSNVAHLVRDRLVAERFAAEWQNLAQGLSTNELRALHENEEPVAEVVPASADLEVVFSPRSTKSTVLAWYGDLFDGAVQSAHITGAFGLNQVFREKLKQPKPMMRTVLLDKVPPRSAAIPRTDPNVRISTGSHLATGPLAQWAQEHLSGFNGHVQYIHTKIILVDPLTPDPTVLSGSANYSDASTTLNEEHTLLFRAGSRRISSRRAMLRLADIYFTEYYRIFMHFVFRAMAQGVALNDGSPARTGHLSETSAWTRSFYEPLGWRTLQRTLFVDS